MSRPTASRLLISGRLVACGPVHVGGVGGNEDVDLALAVNGSGDFYIPGTSLAGAMRAWLSRQTNAPDVNKVWGFQEEMETEDKQGHASFVLVEDGLVTLPVGTNVETRDGVGIDRVWGSAADRVKYDRAVLPAGTEITLNLTVELTTKEDPARESVVAVLKALQLGEIRLGAAKTRGMGRVTLKELQIGEQDLLSFRGMLETLRKSVSPLDVKSMKATSLRGSSALDINIDWKPRGPVMVKTEQGGVAVDMLPLVSARGSDLTFVLPGSAIKGALRSQAERIVRTVCGFSAPVANDSREDFMHQIEMRAAESKADDRETPAMLLISGLFGIRGKTSEEKVTDDGPPLLGLGALTVEDCYALPRFTPQQWETIESAPDFSADDQEIEGPNSPLRKALQAAGLEQLQQAFHVAIDRWTGGAADSCLYKVLEPHAVAWEPIRLTLDLARLNDADRVPAVMCLLLALRDLVNGRLPLGFATNRGMGAIEVIAVEIAANNAGREFEELTDVRLVDGKLGGWSEGLKDLLESSWSARLS